jgi:phosphoribosyl-AMP cyclohydrolase
MRDEGWQAGKYASRCEERECMETHLIDFDKAGGLVPAIAQDGATGQVLMMAWMNREAFEETLRTGRACYFSRSRNRLWRKGEESGNVQEVQEVFIDCDADTILLKVHQIGDAACHEGYKSCFFRRLDKDKVTVVGERVFDPKQVYKK